MKKTLSRLARARGQTRRFGSLTLVLATGSLLAARAGAQTPLSWVTRQLTSRTAAAMSYDVARQRAVLFGGHQGGTGTAPLSDTWEWDGSQWSLRAPAASPARGGHALVYDSARQRTVLFGGNGSSAAVNETWEWDGSSWSRRLPITSPPARAYHALAYDSGRQRVVLFGGLASPSRLDDTWEWDGSNWVQAAPVTRPPARAYHSLAYDAARQRTVLFGGEVGTASRADTWEWDGSNWTQSSPGASPPALQYHAMTYDLVRQRVVLFGGSRGVWAIGSLQSDVWEWDGSNWTLRATAVSPPARGLAVMAYDSTRNRTVVFGGTGADRLLSDTWEWDGATWTQRAPDASPPPSGAMTYDLSRRLVVLFGGNSNTATSVAHDETWEWNGAAWTRRTPATSPPKRFRHAMAYDVLRQRTVLFGGTAGVFVGPLADTWEWDGSNWTQHTPAMSPPARSAHALSYDLLRRRVVMFGGEGPDQRDVVWEWDGTNWSMSTPAVSPPARRSHALTWDISRQRTVLFGGYDFSAALLADTWEWDGSNWSQSLPVTSPHPRRYPGLAYDFQSRRVVLVGGEGVPGILTDTWEWDGSNWTERTPATGPLRDSLASPALAWDSAHERLLVFGNSADTWHLGPLVRATTQPFGTGCAGTSGTPVLVANEPYLGNGAFTLDLLGARAAAPSLFGLARTSQSLPIGSGCTLYLKDPIFPLFGMTNAFGFASVKVSLPLDLSLRGATLFAQVFVADASNPIGIAFTAGRSLVLGD